MLRLAGHPTGLLPSFDRAKIIGSAMKETKLNVVGLTHLAESSYIAYAILIPTNK